MIFARKKTLPVLCAALLCGAAPAMAQGYEGLIAPALEGAVLPPQAGTVFSPYVTPQPADQTQHDEFYTQSDGTVDFENMTADILDRAEQYDKATLLESTLQQRNRQNALQPNDRQRIIEAMRRTTQQPRAPHPAVVKRQQEQKRAEQRVNEQRKISQQVRQRRRQEIEKTRASFGLPPSRQQQQRR